MAQLVAPVISVDVAGLSDSYCYTIFYIFFVTCLTKLFTELCEADYYAHSYSRVHYPLLQSVA